MLHVSALEIETPVPSHTMPTQQANRRGTLLVDGLIGRLARARSGESLIHVLAGDPPGEGQAIPSRTILL